MVGTLLRQFLILFLIVVQNGIVHRFYNELCKIFGCWVLNLVQCLKP